MERGAADVQEDTEARLGEPRSRRLALPSHRLEGPEEKPDPVAELLKPRTWQDMWSMHFYEQIDRGADAADISDQFNLNDTAEVV
jgi:hypothetical protein